MDTLNLNSKEAYRKLEEASNSWSEWHKKVIILDEGRKSTYSKLFLKYLISWLKGFWSSTGLNFSFNKTSDSEYKLFE